MRPVWKGAVSFGLVNIPVKMYTASEDKSIKFSTCCWPVQYPQSISGLVPAVTGKCSGK